jgi:hypothetical protein
LQGGLGLSREQLVDTAADLLIGVASGVFGTTEVEA